MHTTRTHDTCFGDEPDLTYDVGVTTLLNVSAYN